MSFTEPDYICAIIKLHPSLLTTTKIHISSPTAATTGQTLALTTVTSSIMLSHSNRFWNKLVDYTKFCTTKNLRQSSKVFTNSL